MHLYIGVTMKVFNLKTSVLYSLPISLTHTHHKFN